jgi:hypothetical protein
VGFVENTSDPHDLQAWCDECEAYFTREGALTEAFKRFNDFAVVCVACYSELKARHSRGVDGVAPWLFSDPPDLAVFTVSEVLDRQRPGFERLSEALWKAEQTDAWEMSRLACLLLQADGVYRAPDDDGALFMVVHDSEIVTR